MYIKYRMSVAHFLLNYLINVLFHCWFKILKKATSGLYFFCFLLIIGKDSHE